MGFSREQVATFKDAMSSVGVAEIRMPLTTEQAVELAKSLEATEIRHYELVQDAIANIESLGAAPAGGEAALIYYSELARRAASFWELFSCELVDGVEIVRKVS
jgi:hypothetical protein